MKALKYILILTTILMFKYGFSCGNEYGYTLDGTRIYTRYFFLSERMLQFDSLAIQNRISELNEKVKSGEATYRTWSDIAANLMKLGKADSSIKILRPLLKEHPKEYNLIANLGTSYELTGLLDSALKYIKLGYELNPRSHNGSEWIHVKILEAKIKEKQSRGWIKSNNIIPVHELIARVDTANPSKFKRDLRKINQDFFYQIRTRVRFTPPPNQTIANLLLALGDFNAKIGTYENALLAYTYAMRFQNSDYLNRKIKSSIKDLNRKRADQTAITELPDQFIRMMKRSKIDPEILLMGIDDFAEELDSIHLIEVNKADSLLTLQANLDSIVSLTDAKIEKLNAKIESLEKNKTYKYFYLLGGLLLGMLVIYFVKRKN